MAITSQTLLERVDHQIGVPAQNVGTADVTGGYFAMSDFRRVIAVGISEEVTENDTLTIKLVQATNASGAGSKDLTTATTVTAGGAEALLATTEAHVSDLDIAGGFSHVAVVLGGSAAGTVAAATLIRGDGSYRP